MITKEQVRNGVRFFSRNGSLDCIVTQLLVNSHGKWVFYETYFRDGSLDRLWVEDFDTFLWRRNQYGDHLKAA